MSDRLLNKQEAADILSISTRTLERLISAGTLVKVKIRGAVKVKHSEVMKLVETGC